MPQSNKHYPNPYSTGGIHQKPLSESTAGERYRVRDDKPGGKVHAENLTYDQAHRLKEKLAGERKTTCAILESMSAPSTVTAPTAAIHAADHHGTDAIRAAYEAGRQQGHLEATPPPAPNGHSETPTPPIDPAVAEDIANDSLDDLSDVQ